MTISSRTPEGEPFACQVCGAIDCVEPSPLIGDAVCPRCGSYLLSVLARVDELLGGPGPVTLDTQLESVLGYDSLDLLDRLERLESDLGISTDPEEVARCQTFGDLIRYLVRLRDHRKE